MNNDDEAIRLLEEYGSQFAPQAQAPAVLAALRAQWEKELLSDEAVERAIDAMARAGDLRPWMRGILRAALNLENKE